MYVNLEGKKEITYGHSNTTYIDTKLQKTEENEKFFTCRIINPTFESSTSQQKSGDLDLAEDLISSNI